MKNLKEKAIRGGLAKVCSQAANVVVRLVSLMMLARLLDPKDFGLVGMVTAVVGALYLFRDFGLSTAAVQRSSVTQDELSTLFWINILVGVVLVLMCLLAAPLIARFYHEPRLIEVTIAVGASFLFNAAGVQHSAIFQREMRFTALAVIETVALAASSILAVVMALNGYGYWALVVMTAISPLITTLLMWMNTSWKPGWPHCDAAVTSMLRFGGVVTLNGLIVYLAYNIEKVLMGRFWGAETVGIYGRAYQLITMPSDNLNSAVSGIAFSALSRLQDQPARLSAYFLKGYSLVLALSVPTTVFCGVFANDLILVFLGPKWNDAAAIFQLLAPTVLVLACINPMYWLLVSLGLIQRSLRMALVIAPLVITAYLIGFQYGPRGVAAAYSTAMMLWMVPHLAWSVRGTPIGFKEILITIARPLASGIGAALIALVSQHLYAQSLPPLIRLMVGGSLLSVVYTALLFYVMGQKELYYDIVRRLFRRSTDLDKTMLPA